MGVVIETILVTAGALTIVKFLHAHSAPHLQGMAIPGVLVLAALVPAWIGKREFPRIGLHLHQATHIVGTVRWICVCAFPAVFVGLWTLMLLSLPMPLQPVIPLGQSWFAWLFYQFLYVAVAEEVFFRGYIQANAMRLLGIACGWQRAEGRWNETIDTNPKSDNSAEGGRLLPGVVPEIRNPQCLIAILVSAGCFALAHVIVQGQITGALTFFPGLILAWLFLRTGSLLAPILFHGLANVSYTVMAMTLVRP